jgi:D-glycero-alpha-D-manno-heptose-7-phosphate kinase
MGGTLDISTFHYPLHYLGPCTFNIAIDLRTQVRILPYEYGKVRVSSRGFESAEYPLDEAPFDHPLGLMFAIAGYFRAGGVHIVIDSASPPRSALGGSSSAAVALIAAFDHAFGESGRKTFSTRQKVMLAHAIESSVAGVPCGVQDQLAAAYGGVHAWYWSGQAHGALFKKKVVVPRRHHRSFEKHLLLAYCGIPHESKDINGRWVAGFLAGCNRAHWVKIVRYTRDFIDAVASGDYADACRAMNRETALRRELTPDVLDPVGERLVDTAEASGCGARFSGAGGGGCIWALGPADNIDRLQDKWQTILAKRQDACLLSAHIDAGGLVAAG